MADDKDGKDRNCLYVRTTPFKPITQQPKYAAVSSVVIYRLSHMLHHKVNASPPLRAAGPPYIFKVILLRDFLSTVVRFTSPLPLLLRPASELRLTGDGFYTKHLFSCIILQ